MLPSQTARPSASRAHMYRRGTKKPWLAVGGGAVVLILGILVVKWMIGGGDPDSAGAGTPSLQANSGSGDKQPNAPQTNRPPAAPAKPTADANKPKPPESNTKTGNEPVKIAMGGQVPSTALKNEPAKPPSTPATTPPPASPPANPPADSKPTANPAVGSNPPADAPSRLASPPPAVNPTRMPEAGAGGTGAPLSQRVQLGLDLIKQNQPVQARKMLSEALAAPNVAPAEADRIREELTKLNDRLVFGPDITAGDPYVSSHQIASGEALAKLPKKLGLSVDWRFLQRINQISDPARIRAGQKIKVVKGPFHAIIDKRAFRMDLYMGDFSDRVYVRSFKVGLGEKGNTPEGAFVVRPDSKLVNPAWTNPRTGEFHQPDDPKNPLGEYWIGLVGASDNIRGLETYGIHGTIEPDSIGKDMSMGCVRLLADDIKLVYEVLVDNASRVEIHGADWP